MTGQMPTYSLAERDRRWRLARDVMRSEGLDALLVYGEHEDVPAAPFSPDNYFSNDRPGTIVMFFGDEDPVQLVWSPMHVEDHIEAAKRGDELWIEPRNIRVGKDPAHVAALIEEHGVGAGRIGVAGLEPYPPWHILPILPHALYAPLVERFPQRDVRARLVPSGAADAAELGGGAGARPVRRAGGRRDRGGDAGRDASRRDRRRRAGGGMAAGYRRGAQPHILMNTGRNPVSWGDAPWAYRPQQPQVIAEGDVVMSEVLNAVARKETQSQVVIAVGDVAPEIEEAAKVARACYENGLALLRPGHTFGEVADAMVRTLQEAGGWNVHPMVHSMNPYGPVCGFGWGLRTFPPAHAYGELGVVPTIGGELPLEPGMTFAFEPSCVVDGHMVNLGGTVVVGDDEPIELNPSTAQLIRA